MPDDRVHINDMRQGPGDGDSEFYGAIPLRFNVKTPEECQAAAKAFMEAVSEIVETHPQVEWVVGLEALVALQMSTQGIMADLQRQAAQRARDQ